MSFDSRLAKFSRLFSPTKSITYMAAFSYSEKQHGRNLSRWKFSKKMNQDKRFDIPHFIELSKSMNLMNLIIYCNQQCDWLYNSKLFTPKGALKSVEYEAIKYREFVHEFLYVLTNGGKPALMKQDEFDKTKPIIEGLIEKGQLDASILKIYQ